MTVAIGVVLLTAPIVAQEQPVDTTFLNRNIRHQIFLLEYLQEHKPATPPATEEEVDGYVSRAASQT